MKNFKKISREELVILDTENNVIVNFDHKEKITNIRNIEVPNNLSIVQQMIISKYYYISDDFQELIYINKNNKYDYDNIICLFNKGYYCYKDNNKIAILLSHPKQQAIDNFRDSVKKNTLSPFLNCFYKKKTINTLVSDPEEMVSLEMTETDPIVPEKRILSYYLLDTLSTNSSSIDSEHKHLLNFLQSHYPISFAIPSPDNISLNSDINNNWGINLLSSIYKKIVFIIDDKDNSILQISFYK